MVHVFTLKSRFLTGFHGWFLVFSGFKYVFEIGIFDTFFDELSYWCVPTVGFSSIPSFQPVQRTKCPLVSARCDLAGHVCGHGLRGRDWVAVARHC